MTENSKPREKEGTARLVAVDRAAHEMRRGRPVLVGGPEMDGDKDGAGEGATEAVIVVAAEFATEEAFERLKSLAGAVPDLALTHHRARTLKIRLYTDDVVLVPFPSWLTAAEARSLSDPGDDLSFPLRGPFEARRAAVSSANHAAVQLAKIARLLPAVMTVPAPAAGKGGVDAARQDMSSEHVLGVSAAAVMDYEMAAAASLVRVTAARVPLAGAEASRVIAFRSPDGGREHLAVVIGEPAPGAPVLTRLHSECFTGDLIGSLKCDCGQQLRGAIEQIGAAGAGVLLYLRQEGRGIGLINKLRAYALQDQGFDTVEANQRLGFESDERIFLPAAEILRQLGYRQVRLMTNNPDKVAALEQFGIAVTERVPHAFPSNDHNEFYLSTKKKSGHLL